MAEDGYQVQLFCKPVTAGRNLHTRLFHSHHAFPLTNPSPCPDIYLKPSLNHQTAHQSREEEPKSPYLAESYSCPNHITHTHTHRSLDNYQRCGGAVHLNQGPVMSSQPIQGRSLPSPTRSRGGLQHFPPPPPKTK